MKIKIECEIEVDETLWFNDDEEKEWFIECLNDEAELTLIKGLIQWPRVVTSAAHHLEPHRVTNYLYDLASLFHSLWNKGKDNTQLRFIDEKSPTQTAARLVLLQATVCIIAEGLNLLGITPVEEMR